MRHAVDWQRLGWTPEALPEALAAIAASCGLVNLPTPLSARVNSQASPCHVLDARQIIHHAASAQRLDVVPVKVGFCELRERAQQLAPALVQIAVEPGAVAYLALVSASKRFVTLITPALQRCRVPISALCERMTQPLTTHHRPFVEDWLTQVRVARRKRERVRDQLLSLWLADRPIEGVWLIRREPGAPFATSLLRSNVARYAFKFLVAGAGQVVLSAATFWLLGRAVLDGGLAQGWLQAWMLMAAMLVPLQMAASWYGGRMGIGVAALLKQRLLCGALRLSPDSIRRRGTGGLLAMVSESEAIERVAQEGSVTGALALVQLMTAAGFLGVGAVAALQVSALGLVCVLVAVLALRCYRRLCAWTDCRFSLSQRFVEQVQGHRTRLVQGNPEAWHQAEDAQLDHYSGVYRELDLCNTWLGLVTGKGWLLLGCLTLIPGLFSSSNANHIAFSLLGVLQGHQAMRALAQNLHAWTAAAVAFRSIAPLYRGAELPLPHGASAQPMLSLVAARNQNRASALQPEKMLEVKSVAYRYGSGGAYALHDCSLSLRRGDRLLLLGASGSGKSTLGSILTGLHTPSSGLVLLRGLDRASLGDEEWRRHVAAAPQFHENHLVSSTLAFNLLMGCAWPAAQADLERAALVCRSLGLGPLLDRMPAGIQQVVGETGWQLSHGERSRVFLARALLQNAAIVVLDESFGALDPETLELCMGVVRDQVQTLVVIAHP